MERARRPVWLIVAVLTALAALAAAAVVAVVLQNGGDDDQATTASSDVQTVHFQKPTESGPDPFTQPADVPGDDKVDVGSGPFGGTGSDLVCDRELLIESLRARPDRMREWAGVLGVEPRIGPVARYIRRLRAVTLVTDTRVTNHSFVNGRAVAYQAILQAGTAVLVDKDGKPVARCRCGNPLLEPIFVNTAKCVACPPNYRPPPPCFYFNFDDSDYARYDDDEFVSAYDPSAYRGKCYLPYPDPPPVKQRKRRPPPASPPSQPATNPSASFSPRTGRRGDAFTLFVSGFRPNQTLDFQLTRPDGVLERYSITTDSSGSGSYSFSGTGENDVLGDYTAVVTDSGTGDNAAATATLLEAEPSEQPEPTEPQPEPAPQDELQCDPARSQLEFEQCRDAGLLPSQE